MRVKVRDEIFRARNDLLEAGETPIGIKITKETAEKLGYQLGLKGEAVTLFHIPVEIDNNVDEFEIITA